MVVGEQQTRLEQQVWEIGAQRHRVRLALPAGVRLVRSAAPRFHRPNDPVVVLAGEGIAAPAADIKDEVRCACDVPGPPPAAFGFDGAERLPHPEAAHLAWLGAHAAAEAEGLPDAEIALRPWRFPWRPVELAWRVALQLPNELGARGPLAPGVVLANYALDEDALDFTPCRDDFDSLPDCYEGRSPLAANATAALETQLEAVVEDDLLRRLREKPLVTQSLGGFTQALAMLDQTLQLPVADPYGSPLDQPFVRRVAEAVGDEARFGPLPDNPFAPLRSGRFTLSALRLVDEFGRWRDVDTSDPTVCEMIPRHGRALAPPLRLTQAAQLRFRWRIEGRHATEASVAPAGSPICGWVVPNRLDGGVLLYGGVGQPVGRLVPGATDAVAPEWFGPPNVDDAGGLAEALAPHNAVLRAFGLSLLDNGPAYLRALTATLDATQSYIAPVLAGADRELAMLLGNPLALVQAELDLTLLGLPLIDMSLAALRADIGAEDPLARSDRGSTRVRFGVRLGDLPRADDGLIGFFASGADGAPDFGTFYADADGTHAAIRPAAADTLTLTSRSRRRAAGRHDADRPALSRARRHRDPADQVAGDPGRPRRPQPRRARVHVPGGPADHAGQPPLRPHPRGGRGLELDRSPGRRVARRAAGGARPGPAAQRTPAHRRRLVQAGPAGADVKLRLSAEPAELERPGTVTLEWTVTGATSVLLSAAGAVSEAGSMALRLEETTTIVLTAFDAGAGRVACKQVTVTVLERVPRGVIVPWWGDADNPPAGWAICDGSEGTPDLSGRFIRGADGLSVVPHSFGDGRSHRHGLPAESLELALDAGGAHDHHGWGTREYRRHKRGRASIAADADEAWTGGAHAHRLRADLPAFRASKADDPLPPFYGLHYLMKR